MFRKILKGHNRNNFGIKNLDLAGLGHIFVLCLWPPPLSLADFENLLILNTMLNFCFLVLQICKSIKIWLPQPRGSFLTVPPDFQFQNEIADNQSYFSKNVRKVPP